MIVVFNGIGLIMIVVGAAFVLLATALPPPYRSWPLFACGLVWVGWDVAYRWTHGRKSFISPQGGGHVYYVPMWALGALLFWAAFGVQKFDQDRSAEARQIGQRIQDLRFRQAATVPTTTPASHAPRQE